MDSSLEFGDLLKEKIGRGGRSGRFLCRMRGEFENLAGSGASARGRTQAEPGQKLHPGLQTIAAIGAQHGHYCIELHRGGRVQKGQWLWVVNWWWW